MDQKIPKVIHYCWFGGKPLPQMAKKCIASWQKYMPDYEIRQWDESNFDINATKYTKEAYSKKLYAFVSDYARFKILNDNGGIYLDTDVEIIKPLDEIIEKGPYLGIESGDQVNPGLGRAAVANMDFIAEVLHHYDSSTFIKSDNTIDYDTVVVRTTRLLKSHGWTGKEKKIAGFFIYPEEYFCPMDYNTKKIHITKNTYTIHLYAATWISPCQKFYAYIKQLFGERSAQSCSMAIKAVKNIFK